MDGDDAKVTRVGPPGSGGPPAGRSFSAAFSARFEIQSTLGSGGMGVVYLAVDKSLDRPVAIKFSHAQDAEALARFAREGRVLARLRHPNLIQVYDTGEEGGHPFLVIEVAEGESLAERLERDGELEPLETLGFALQIAAGLVSAHGQGVLHRDLKCANILITSEGSIKICDFGLARTASVSDRVTTDGAFLGTPEYLAPELVEGAPASVASDLYAFGCVLTEMLTGLPPFPQQQKDGTSLSISDVVAAHLTKPIPIPSQRVPGIAPELDALVAACLAKKPSGRPKDATSVLAELEALERKEAVRSHVRLRAASGVRPRGSRVSASPAPTTLILSRPVDADATGPHSMVPPAASSSRRLLAGVAASLLLLGLSVLAARTMSPEPVLLPRKSQDPLAGLTPIGSNTKGCAEYVHAKSGVELVQIPAGEFLRGYEQGADDERPVRRIRISPFFIGKTPVTRRQYFRFCREAGAKRPAEPDWNPADDHPIVGVTWHDVVAYCSWAGLRLPSEAEWEYGARGADGRLYPWGDAAPDAGGAYRANYSQGKLVLDGFPRTSPVGSFGPKSPLPRADGSSPFGLLDMAGNVWQWCQDTYDQRFYEQSPSTDPLHTLPSARRPLRGGAWYSTPQFLRSTYRYDFLANETGEFVGFRVAR